MKKIITMFSDASIARAEKYPTKCYVEVDTIVGSLNLGALPLDDNNEVIFDDVMEDRLQDALDNKMLDWKNKQWGEPTITPHQIADSITSAGIYC